MGLSDTFGLPAMFKRRRDKVGTHHTYALTPLGKTKAEEFSLQGPLFEALAYLDENGASSVWEISEGTKMSNDKIKAMLKKLIRAGYVKRASPEE